MIYNKSNRYSGGIGSIALIFIVLSIIIVLGGGLLWFWKENQRTKSLMQSVEESLNNPIPSFVPKSQEQDLKIMPTVPVAERQNANSLAEKREYSESEYIDFATNLVQRSGAIIKKVDRATKDVKAKNITVSQYKIIVDQASKDMNKVLNTLNSAKPPPKFETSRMHLKNAMESYSTGFNELYSFLETNNKILFDSATKLILNGAVEILEAGKSLGIL